MLRNKILNTIKKYALLQRGDKVLIGVSGGPDSMCLLDALYHLREELQIELIVAHVNHGIRKEADEETLYVQNYCKQKQIDCFIKKVDAVKLANLEKLGLEEMGRKIRYDFFEEVAKKEQANKIATAHNANDNSETVLMNFLRGSSITGLKGIELKRTLGKIDLIRPLRECSRQQIEEYCIKEQLDPKIDLSNFENDYTRNKIRNQLIPYLQKEFNPNIMEGLNRMSQLAKEEEEYFTQIISKEYENLKIGENEQEIILDLKRFNDLPKVIKAKLLFYTIGQLLGTSSGIEKIHIEDIIKLCQNNIGNKYLTPKKNIKILVEKGKIFFINLK